MAMDLNDPPHLPPEGGFTQPPPGVDLQSMIAELERDQQHPPDAAVTGPGGIKLPSFQAGPQLEIDLPAGLISSGENGPISFRTAHVRELVGYDEERLARIDKIKNSATWVTELLTLGVTEIVGTEIVMDKQMARHLLIGDRDELMLAIRKVTYGPDVIFEDIKCPQCETEQTITVNTDDDIPRRVLDDPFTRNFDVPLKNGHVANVGLLNGAAQEQYLSALGKKTQAEINTLMLSLNVALLDGVPTQREDSMRRLSVADRETITNFIAKIQPGPNFAEPIVVPCASCGFEFRFILGLADLFRF